MRTRYTFACDGLTIGDVDFQSMNTEASSQYVCGIFLQGKRIFLIRTLNDDGQPDGGFHFPGGRYDERVGKAEALSYLLKRKYGFRVKILAPIGSFTSRGRGGVPSTIYPFLCHSDSRILLPTNKFQTGLVDLDDIDSTYLDPLDRIVSEKIHHYLPLYTGGRRLIKRSDSEAAEVQFYISSLLYYGGRIPNNEKRDFLALTKTDATIKQIREAYKWTLRVQGLDYNEYLDYIERKKDKK